MQCKWTLIRLNTDIFITHLHVDHFGSLPYLYEFGGWAGRWHEPLTVYGPSGADEEYGTKWMVDGMLKMLNWHKDAFDVFPSGNQIRVVEFDFKDDGGVIYEKVCQGYTLAPQPCKRRGIWLQAGLENTGW